MMTKMIATLCCSFLLLAAGSSAWAPSAHRGSSVPGRISPLIRVRNSSLRSLKTPGADNGDVVTAFFDPLNLSLDGSSTTPGAGISFHYHLAAPMFGAVALLSSPAAASAATKAAPDAIPSALFAYAHYLSILIIVASVMTERLTVKPAMSIEEEKRIAIADIMTGVSGIGLLFSGYYRATQYGKGWDFYSHEPIFWLKMAFLGIFGGLSLFPTITIIQRSVKIQQEGMIEPMSEALAKRLTSILNAELSALAFIPLTATFMARGVGYIYDFPTQIVGPVFFGLVTAGSVYKYAKDAILWKEDEVMVVKEE